MSEGTDQVTIPTESAPAAEPVVVEPVAPAAAPAPAAEEKSKPKAVFVENLSPEVKTATLDSFFSLCGPIESISLRPKPKAEDGTLEATVFFESSTAADTAVLLTNAMLLDRTITITYYTGDKEAEGQPAEGAKDSAADGSSVWASILAAGFKFSDDVQAFSEGVSARAAEVDAKYNVSKGFEDTVDKIDQTLGITQKFNAMSTAVQQKSEELGVNQKMEAIGAGIVSAGETLGRAAGSVLDSAMQNQYVSSAWNTLSGWGSSLVAGWTQLSEEANQLYTQQTGRVRNAPAAAPAAVPATDAAAPEGTASTPAETVSVPTDAAAPAANAEPAPEASPEVVQMPPAPTN